MDDLHHHRHRRSAALDLRAAPAVIQVVCDQCDRNIDRAQGDWLGVDQAALDDDGELIQPEDEYQHHFCSWTCLHRWAFAQEYNAEWPGDAQTSPAVTNP